MKRMGIKALYRRPNTSKPAPDHPVYPYLLKELAVSRQNLVWAMDISYVPMARGFVYLAPLRQRIRGMSFCYLNTSCAQSEGVHQNGRVNSS